MGRRLRIVDLFCGCGGLTLGALEAARSRGCSAEVSLAIDNDPDAIGIYARNFKRHGAPPILGDVSTLFSQPGLPITASERRLRMTVPCVDLLVAGPPCQGHSDLNNRSRRKDPRNGLYATAVRAVEILNPVVVLIENVPPVIHDHGNVVHDSMARLRHAGYYVKTTIVNASEIGLAQRRRRHLLIASRTPFDPELALSRYAADRPASVGEYLSDLVDEADSGSVVFRSSSKMMADNTRRVLWLFRNEMFDLPNRLRPVCHRNGHSYVSMYGRMRWDQPAQTITSGFGCMGQGRFVHPLRPRTLTPHEAARLQGFPDFFSFDDVIKRTSLQQIIGNAVPPKVAATFVAGLIDQECI